MSEESNNNSNWKSRAYINGTLIGAAIGVIGAYLYARAAEEDAARNGGQPTPLKTGTLLSIALAVLSLIRQITEAGKSGK
jgi:predicted outer membrane lipoprotein